GCAERRAGAEETPTAGFPSGGQQGVHGYRLLRTLPTSVHTALPAAERTAPPQAQRFYRPRRRQDSRRFPKGANATLPVGNREWGIPKRLPRPRAPKTPRKSRAESSDRRHHSLRLSLSRRRNSLFSCARRLNGSEVDSGDFRLLAPEAKVVLLDTSTGETESEFHAYVQSPEHPVLSEFCTELPGIKQAQVDEEVPLKICLSQFCKWIQKTQQQKKIIFASGVADLSTSKVKLCAFDT
uniref:Exonuclease domain-containing protein n=1 Tax=Equus asinus TaxID=9793 RepID=A0A9L0J962_EQUAS